MSSANLFTILGSGTSQGVPVIGCNCPVCTSMDPRDQRFRSSALFLINSKNYLIDCGPDFRQQMLKSHIQELESVYFTHEHNDHIIGLDDLRPLIFTSRSKIKLFAEERVLNEIQHRFAYAFSENKYPGAPSFTCIEIQHPYGKTEFGLEYFRIMHGNLPILGYKFNKMAYITDAKSIPEESFSKISEVSTLVINCIKRENAHHSHFILEDIIELKKKLPKTNIYLTHMSHSMGTHEEMLAYLPDGIFPAWDGMQIVL